MSNPRASQKGLQIREVGNEVIVIDRSSNQVHRLTASVAFVWRHCDGSRSDAELSALVAEKLRARNPQEVVALALAELTRCSLLEGYAPIEVAASSRRDFMRKAGVAAGLTALLPAIDSIFLSRPAHGDTNTGCRGEHHGGYTAGALGKTKRETLATLQAAADAKAEAKCRLFECPDDQRSCVHVSNRPATFVTLACRHTGSGANELWACSASISF
jgi:hypothetical protein